jgi:hypothetical protein
MKRKEKLGKRKEAKKLMQNVRLNMQKGSETNPVSLRFALKRKRHTLQKMYGALPFAGFCQFNPQIQLNCCLDAETGFKLFS